MTNYSVDFVIKLALILLLSTLPSLAYLLIFRRAKGRWNKSLRRAQNVTTYQLQPRNRYDFDYDDLVTESRIPAFLGDTNCVNNARSSYLRCAINPSGPCNECSHYEEHY